MNNRVWLCIASALLILGIAAAWGAVTTGSDAGAVSTTGLHTDGRNRSLLYDAAGDALYIGTHEGGLWAYQGDQLLWQAPPAAGAHCKLVMGQSGSKIYAANEGQHVYVYSAADGSLLTDINVQRMVVGLSVNGDESRIAVITNTRNSKSNLIVYSSSGEELYNTAYTSTTLRQVEYCADGEHLLVANKKGEVNRMTQDGAVTATYKCNYDVVQMNRLGDKCIVLGLDGTYHVLDDELTCIRRGKVDNTVKASMSTIGTDLSGECVFVGTEDGYIYVMDAQDQQIYVADCDAKITDTAPGDGCVYFCTLNGQVSVLSFQNIFGIAGRKALHQALRVLCCVLFAAAAICAVMGTPRLRGAVVRLAKSLWKARSAYLFLAPVFIVLFFFSYRGIFIGITRAFTNWSRDNYTLAQIDFVGLDNFRAILQDHYFFVGVKNLAIILATNLIKILTVPILIAWLIYNLNGDRRKYLHRFFFVLPIVVPGVVSVMMWQRIYDPTVGLINNLLDVMNLPDLKRVWLGDSSIALWSIIFMGFPFVGALPMLLYYGALGNIGEEITEAALIDGGNKWHIFWRIQLPLIRPQIALMVMLTFISSIQDYATIYIMTGGGPGTSTYVPALELYLNVSQFGKYGYASAMGVVILIFTLTVTLVSNFMSKREDA